MTAPKNPAQLEPHAELMPRITAKATLAAKAGNLNPNAFDVGTIVSIIAALFGALSKCGILAPTPARVHKAITNPGPIQRRSLRDTIREHVDNPALWSHVESGIIQVGKASTIEETSAMYREANGFPPA